MIGKLLAASGALATLGGLVWMLWQKRRLDRKHQAQILFYATLGHELKTPLNGIIGFVELLQSDGLADAERRQFLRNVDFSARTLLAMINNLLDCAKLHAGHMQLHVRPTDLAKLIHELPALLHPLLLEKRLRLEIDLPPDLPMLQLDGDRLRQILLNLIGNAIKFSDHGVIMVRGAFQEAASLPGRLTLQVIDHGRGIRQEYRKKIFEPFVQQRQDAARGNGTGLGLFITLRLVQLMEGSIELESEPGQGSCFTVTLPVVATQ